MIVEMKDNVVSITVVECFEETANGSCCFFKKEENYFELDEQEN